MRITPICKLKLVCTFREQNLAKIRTFAAVITAFFSQAAWSVSAALASVRETLPHNGSPPGYGLNPLPPTKTSPKIWYGHPVWSLIPGEPTKCFLSLVRAANIDHRRLYFAGGRSNRWNLAGLDTAMPRPCTRSHKHDSEFLEDAIHFDCKRSKPATKSLCHLKISNTNCSVES